METPNCLASCLASAEDAKACDESFEELIADGVWLMAGFGRGVDWLGYAILKSWDHGLRWGFWLRVQVQETSLPSNVCEWMDLRFGNSRDRCVHCVNVTSRP